MLNCIRIGSFRTLQLRISSSVCTNRRFATEVQISRTSNTAEARLAIWQRLEIEERKRRIYIILAVEGGSRAFGMHTPQSDFDVRFLYVHDPHWYVSLKPGRDVIELGVEKLAGGAVLDVSGWELRKGMNLGRHSNAGLLEWLHSPIVYRSDDEVSNAIRSFIDASYSRRSIALHYYHSAMKLMEADLQGKETVTVRTMMWIIRPLAILRWLQLHQVGYPPMHVGTLLQSIGLEPHVYEALNSLLEMRKKGEVRTVTSSEIEVATRWCEKTTESTREFAHTAPHQEFAAEPADKLFRSIINGCWRHIRDLERE